MNDQTNRQYNRQASLRTRKFVQQLKKISKPRAVLYGLLIFVSVLSLVGLLASTLLVQESQDQRSEASGGATVTSAQMYLDPPYAVRNMGGNSGSIVQTTLKTNLGRAITGISFGLEYDAVAVNSIQFQLNSQYVGAYVVSSQQVGQNKRLFMVYQITPNNAVAINPGTLGTVQITLTPEFEASNESISLVKFIPQNPTTNMPNQAVVLGSTNEIISFNPSNGLLVLNASGPASVVPTVNLSWRPNPTANWTEISGQNFEFAENMIVRAVINVDAIEPQLSSLPSGAVKKPSFQLRVTNGAIERGVRVSEGWPGSQPQNIVQDYKVIADGSQKALVLLASDGSVVSGQQIPLLTGDSVDVRVNSRYVVNGVAVQCKHDDQVVIFKEGSPQNQMAIGACDNDSRRVVTNGAVAPPTAPTPTPPAFVPQFVPQVKIFQRASQSADPWVEITSQSIVFDESKTYKMVLNRPAIRPTGIPDANQLVAFRVQVTRGAVSRGTLVQVNDDTGPSGNYVQDFKLVTVDGQSQVVLVDSTGEAIPNQELPFISGDSLDIRVNLHHNYDGSTYTCKEDDLLVSNPIGRPQDQSQIGVCDNQSRKVLGWQN